MSSDRCTCATDGNAHRCPYHTQRDFEMADAARAQAGGDCGHPRTPCCGRCVFGCDDPHEAASA